MSLAPGRGLLLQQFCFALPIFVLLRCKLLAGRTAQGLPRGGRWVIGLGGLGASPRRQEVAHSGGGPSQPHRRRLWHIDSASAYHRQCVLPVRGPHARPTHLPCLAAATNSAGGPGALVSHAICAAFEGQQARWTPLAPSLAARGAASTKGVLLGDRGALECCGGTGSQAAAHPCGR